MKQKTLREDAHSREAETCRKRPRFRRENVPRHILFHAVKFIIHPVLCKISNSENTVCKSELFVIYFPIFFSVAYFLIP